MRVVSSVAQKDYYAVRARLRNSRSVKLKQCDLSRNGTRGQPYGALNTYQKVMSREDSTVLPASRRGEPGEGVAVVIQVWKMMTSSDVFGCCVQWNGARASRLRKVFSPKAPEMLAHRDSRFLDISYLISHLQNMIYLPMASWRSQRRRLAITLWRRQILAHRRGPP